jgi:hypothetical protein
MKYLVIQVNDLPGARSRIWGSVREKAFSGTTVAAMDGVPYAPGWKDGAASAGVKRAWAVPLALLTRPARAELLALNGAGIADLIIHGVDEDDDSFDPRAYWKARLAWADRLAGPAALPRLTPRRRK